MAEPEEVEEDLFADLYDGDDGGNNIDNAHAQSIPLPPPTDIKPQLQAETQGYGEEPDTGYDPTSFDVDNNEMDDVARSANDTQEDMDASAGGQQYEEHAGVNMKEDGKMFIGGLNWETTDQSLRDYFSQFGEVQECTVMREASGRSRGFGFLTFKDPKTVNIVMAKEHFLDGKLIDPKRAIPRDEQEKTAKIFVGGVSQDATEHDFTSFFAQFGRVIDATLMMDKDTGRPRGFGFVTFDGDGAVERCLNHHPLEILGKPIEVKRAQPRGKIGEENDFSNRGGRPHGRFGRDDRPYNNNNSNNDNQQPNQMQQNQPQGMTNGMTPQMMAQYWQRMQQYFSMMQQQMAANAMGMGMGMGQMNPQMMAQMQQMQMQQMQKQMQGGGSPNQQGGMNPQMQQQMMQQMMAMQGGNMGQAPSGPRGARQSFSPQEQQAFEQQKYEQQSRRPQNHNGPRGNQGQQQGGGPQSWEGMYDDVPQPNDGSGVNRAGSATRNLTPTGYRGSKGHTPTPQPVAAPANAPTGPKNAGKPGSNFRGGRGNRFHPYGR